MKPIETNISVTPAELNLSQHNQIKKFIVNRKNIDATISLKEFDPSYAEDLGKSIEAESGEHLISFTPIESKKYWSWHFFNS